MIRGQLTWRGVTFGLGTDIEIVDIKGLDDLPAVDNATALNPRSDGGRAGDAYAQTRTVEVELEIVSGDTSTARQLLRDTTVYTRGGITEPLTILVDGTEILLNAQLVRRSLELTNEYVYVNNPVVQWLCPDPRRYGAAFAETIPLPVAGAGPAYPFAYPQAYVVTPGEPGSRVITNNGSYDTPPVMRLNGPASLPTVYFQFPSGETWSMSLDLDLGSGEWIDLNVLNGTALLGGTADRSGALSGALLSEMLLPPGPTTVGWYAASGTSEANLEITGYDAEM